MSANEIVTIDDYFKKHAEHHVRKATDVLDPLHKSDDPISDFRYCLRKPYEPQAHVIAAAAKMLGASKRGLIVGEMGTGKTIMGQLAIHEHAQLGIRKGGKRGNYRAIIICPDHLIKKWKDELEMTIPGCKVTTFDVKCRGQAVLLREMVELYTELKGKKGRWKKPVGPNWYVIGRDQSKYLPSKKPAAMRRLGLVKIEDEEGAITTKVIKQDRCPRCGLIYRNPKNGKETAIRGTKQIVKCQGVWHREIGSADGSNEGLDFTSPRQITDSPLDREGRIFEQDGKEWVVVHCKTPLWQYTPQFRRWPPGKFFADKLRHAFDYVIVDEIHEHKDDEAAQANASAKFIAGSPYCLALTGTLIGGYARDLFPLLFRFAPGDMIEEGFEWGGDMPFTREYGRVEKTERIVTKFDTGEVIETTDTQSMRKTRNGGKNSERAAPGVMPALFGKHLVDKAIFIALDDMANDLPAYREYVGGPPAADYTTEEAHYHQDTAVSMEEAQAREYRRVEGTLVANCREMLQKGQMKLLGTMLMTTLDYPDRPWDWKAPTGNPDHLACGYWEKPGNRHPDNYRGVIQPASLDQSIIYPKEQALLDIAKREIGAGNQLWVYCTMTDKRDVQPRLQHLLQDEGLRVKILRGKQVKPRKRLQWIDDNGPKADVIISHAELVKTGIDFFGKGRNAYNFNAICFYQTGYNLFTLRQAARRAWRLSQRKSCRVYYAHYAGTMQARAMELMARKYAAAVALDGQLNVEGLCAMADDQSAAMALARSISNAIDETDIRRNWAKVSSKPAVANPMLELGIDSLEADPFDELDLLPFEPALLAKTLLDHEEVSPTGLSRAMLAKMAHDLFDTDDMFADLDLVGV